MLPDCEIIDAHHHFGRRGPTGSSEFGASDLIALMDAYGIQRALAMHFVSPLQTANDFVRANEYVAEAVSGHSTRLFGVVVVNPQYGEDALAQIETYAGSGFRAVKLHPAFHRFELNGGLVDEVFALAASHDLPVVVHSDFSDPFCTPYDVAHLARRLPELTVVMAHMGMRQSFRHLIVDIARGIPNLYFDTSQTPDFPGDVYAEPVRALGADRLMFGSDGPDCDPSVNLRKVEVAIERYGLTAEDAACVLSGNARRVYGLKAAV